MTCGLATALEPPHFNHAPVRGATPAPDLRIRGRVVSIHAPAWGATRLARRARRSPFCFNPRTRVGCDCSWAATSGLGGVSLHAPAWGAPSRARITHLASGQVSIHAPAWGATRRRRDRSRWISGFNPRTRVGCDVSDAAKAHYSTMFQSTHPRGVRRVHCAAPAPRSRCFNPRTRVGCDPRSYIIVNALNAVSIHAPAWGATTATLACWRCQKVSIHAPAWGATMSCRPDIEIPHGFNPRTRVGCDAQCRPDIEAPHGFNPRTRVGCDPLHQLPPLAGFLFQSTHPRGVRP